MKLRSKIFLALIPFVMVGIITGGEFNSNVVDLWYKLIGFHEHNYNLGGLHRVAVIAGWGVIMALLALLACKNEER